MRGRRGRRLVLGALCALLGFGTALAIPGAARSSAAPSSDVLRILLLGDSVTQGTAGDWTWRYRLWQQLRDTGVAFDFVGPRDDLWDVASGSPGSSAYADPSFDRDHAARWGMRLGALDVPVADLALAHRPDVVVVMLGVNDLLDGRLPEAVAEDTADLVAELRAAAPSVAIVLSQATQHWFPGVVAFNEALSSLAAAASTAASPVAIATPAQGYDVDLDTWDHSHPNATGEAKIAGAVALALRELGIGAPPPPPTVSLGAPEDVRWTAGRRCTRLAWQHVDHATSYWVQRRVDGRWTRGVRTTGTRVTLVRLPIQRAWRFRIRAVHASTPGPPATVTVKRRWTGRCS